MHKRSVSATQRHAALESWISVRFFGTDRRITHQHSPSLKENLTKMLHPSVFYSVATFVGWFVCRMCVHSQQ